MSIAYDAYSVSSVSTSAASFSWTHTPAGTPAGVYVATITSNSATEHATAVTYGGVAMTAETGGSAVDTLGEPGVTTLWSLNSGVPSGAQSVVVTRTNDTIEMLAYAITVTSGGGCSVVGIVLLQEDGTIAEQSVDDGSPGTNSVRFAAGYCGAATAPTAGANSTLLHSIATLGSSVRSAALVRETTAGQGARSVGMVRGATDDRAVVHWAVKETATGLSITSVTPTDVYSQQVDVVVAGTKLSNSAVVTFAGAACTGLSASSSTSLKITMPNFYTNNIKVGTVKELKIIG